MSGLDRRLGGLSPGLSARERVIMILRADAEGLPENPAWRRGMPDFQASECNHFIGIANGVNHVLVPHATVLLCEVETLEARFQLLAALVGWSAERTLRRERDGDATPDEPTLSPPWTVMPVFGMRAVLREESALSEADRGMRELGRGLAREIPRCWSRLLALKLVVDEVREEFQDEVVVPEVLRDFLQLIRAKLERLYDQAPQLVGELERPEADETTVDMLDRGIEAQHIR